MKRMLNIQKSIILICIIGSFYTCIEREKNADSKTRTNVNKYSAEIHKAGALLLKPDSLRSPDEKVLWQRLEAVYYEDCVIRNDKFEISISKTECEAKGIPEVYYDMLTMDVNNMNNMLDTTSFPKQVIFDSFLKSQAEYKKQKGSQSAK